MGAGGGRRRLLSHFVIWWWTRGIAPGRHLCRAYAVAQSSVAELRNWVDVLRTCWSLDTSLIMG